MARKKAQKRRRSGTVRGPIQGRQAVIDIVDELIAPRTERDLRTEAAVPFSRILEDAQRTHAERGEVYGDCYRRHGLTMKAMFREPVTLRTEQDYNRFGVFNMIVSKLVRYSGNFVSGHIDSIHDAGIYALMLEELDRDGADR